MKRVIVAILILSATLFGMSDKELATAINLAGKQRMLTQKITKESLLLYIGIDIEKTRNSLKESSALFDKTLNGLLNGDKNLGLVKSNNHKIEAKLKEVKKLWKPFYKVVKSVYTMKNINHNSFTFIDNNNIPLLKKMNDVVTLYSKLGDSKTSKLKMANDINLAGKQRMLTEKIAKDILLYQANINKQVAIKDLKESIALFDKTLQGLLNGDKELNLIGTKLPKIVKQLNVTKISWQKAKSLIPKVIKDKENQNLTKELIVNLDKTKIEMNKAVELYVKSLNRQKQIMKLNTLINGFMNKKSSSKHLINLAGKQRMLTQRISKLAIECSLKLMPNSCKQLNKYVSLYDKTLNGFINGDKELKLSPINQKDALTQIDKIKTVWNPFKTATINLEKSLGKDKNAINIIEKTNIKLLKESDKLVSILENSSAKNISYIEKAKLKIVNIAGRERMLTQKMTKELLEYLKLNNTKAKDEVKKSVNIFDNSLNALIDGSNKMQLPKVTNETIKKQLIKVKAMWQKIKPFYSKEKLSNKELTLLLKVNPILLKEMNRAVSIIENSTDY